MVGGEIVSIHDKNGLFKVTVAECPCYPKHKRGECPRLIHVVF